MSAQENEAKILILATEDCAYPGANAVGQAHMSYPENTYVIRVRAPVMLWSAPMRAPIPPWPPGWIKCTP